MMLFRMRLRAAVALILVFAALSCPAFATQTTKQLAVGVSLFQDINTNSGSELIVNSVTVEPKTPGVSVKAALGKDVVYVSDPAEGRENISELTGRRKAVVGINADFFPFTGDPLGLCIIDGELASEPNQRAIVGITKTGDIIFDRLTFDAKLTLASGVSRQIDGINRERKTNQVVLYTSLFGARTPGKYAGTEITMTSTDLPVKAGKAVTGTVTGVLTDSKNNAIPAGGMVLSAGGPAAYFLAANLKPGDKVTVQFDLKADSGVDCTTIDQAVCGGPRILKDGQTFIDLKNEGIGATFSTYRHPRTAVGATADGKLLLVTVDGRQSFSRGISLPDLADVMKKLGARDAINLDGGGSTTMSYRGMVINSPSGGMQRPVADALLVFADPETTEEIRNLSITAPPEVAVGKGAQLTLTCGADARPLTSEQLQNVIWGTAKGNGFVNQQGYVIPNSLRRSTIQVMCGTQSTTLDVTAVAGPPAKLSAKLASDEKDPNLAKITVTVTDAGNMPCAGKPVVLNVNGGKADVPVGVTNDKGEFSAVITWDAAVTDHSVTVTSGELTATATMPAVKSTP